MTLISSNNKINSLQFSMLGILIGMSLFEGLASVFLFNTSRQDAWITTILSFGFSFIFYYLIYKLFNYEPNKNIIEKINHLFGNKLGNIINFVLILIVIYLLLLSTWSILNFIEIIYLTETPLWFIGAFLIGTVTYVVSKGIETITRTTQVLIYFSALSMLIISIFLFEFIDIDNLKPFLERGISPLLRDSLALTGYTVIPFFLLLIIPKKDISDQRKIKKYFLIGFITSSILVIWVSFVVMTTIGPELSELYRFPTYYTLNKIGVPGVFQNMENFLSCLWISATIILIFLTLHYLYKYIKITFKIKKVQNKKRTLLVTSFIIFILVTNPISNAGQILRIIKETHSYIAFTTFLIILLIFCGSTITKKNKTK